MELRRLPLPPIGANCYLIRSEASPQGLILDPGGDPPQVIAQCQALGMTPAAILLTHGHFDHVGAVGGLLERWPGLPVYCHPGDVSDVPGQLTWQKVPSWLPLSDNQELNLAGLRLKVLHTPGHSKGSCCFLVGDVLFTGDTLFASSIGRTDFPGGDMGEMTAALRRLAALPGDLKVYPGHESPTTLDRERRSNPWLTQAMRR